MRYALALLLAVTMLNMAAPAVARDAVRKPVNEGMTMFDPVGREPLVTIRFNQRNVMFKRPLYGALSQALEAKSSVMFDLVSYAPVGDSRRASADHAKAAQANLNAVAQAMTEMGVPANRCTRNMVRDASLSYNEVRLYVR